MNAGGVGRWVGAAWHMGYPYYGSALIPVVGVGVPRGGTYRWYPGESLLIVPVPAIVVVLHVGPSDFAPGTYLSRLP